MKMNMTLAQSYQHIKDQIDLDDMNLLREFSDTRVDEVCSVMDIYYLNINQYG